MSLPRVHSRARAGVDAPLVRIEVHLSGDLPVTQIVGLSETSVRESRERVRAALLCACPLSARSGHRTGPHLVFASR